MKLIVNMHGRIEAVIFCLLIAPISFNYAVAQKQFQAAAVLNSVFSPFTHSRVVAKHEWRELHLDQLLQVLDRTTTSFGRWGLEQLLHPITDISELRNRQSIISFLVENEDVLQLLQKNLRKIECVEADLLVYWDQHDDLSRSVQSFYYTISFLKEECNKNPLILECGIALEAFNSTLSLLRSMCLSGLHNEFIQVLSNSAHDFSFFRAIRSGFEEPLLMHSLKLHFLQNSSFDKYSFKLCMMTMLSGSFGDRYKIMNEGWLQLPSLLAALGAASCTIAYDIKWTNELRSVCRNIIQMHKTLNRLQNRIAHNATMINVIMHFADILHKSNSIHLQSIWDTYAAINYAVTDCIKQLQAERFSCERSYIYSRGQVLYMHARIQKIKQAFVPLLQTVGIIDAYCSLAQLYKEHRDTATPFCFVQYDDSIVPTIQCDEAWFSCFAQNNIITNTVSVGGGAPSKVVITGPNGGGKSTYLKTVGQLAVLGQSWTIIPARTGQQTLFGVICTGLAPYEDVYQGLSTFMAEKRRMEEMCSVIKSSSTNRHVLALIDEPYRGTVDEESAKRIYTFGVHVAHDDNAVIYIATHVKKPIDLARDTWGAFVNYHIQIDDKGNEGFERTFKLAQGPALWWFEDENKRAKFVDWIN